MEDAEDLHNSYAKWGADAVAGEVDAGRAVRICQRYVLVRAAGPPALLPGTASHHSVPNGSGWGGKCRTSRDLIPCLRREHLTGSGYLEAFRPLATVMGSGMNV